MKSCFYPRLAFTNIKKNAKIYIPYILMSSFTVMMFYLINYLSSHPGLEKMASGTRTIKITLNLGIIVVCLFSIIFLFYMNSFLMKRRKKEIALYNILGLEKKHIMIMIFFETLMTSLISLLLGFLFGIIFSQLVSLLLINLAGITSALTFHISWSSLLITLLVFSLIYFVSYLIHVIQIHLSNPIELIQGSQSGEKEPKTKWLMTLIGMVSLSSGYYIAVTIDDPITAIVLFFIAVLLVILGTYFLFIAGSITLLKLLKKNKYFYYQTRHFTSVSQLIYRMKQNAVGLASICILITCILVMLSSTVSLYYGIEDTVSSYQQDSYHLRIYGYDDETLPTNQQFNEFYDQIQNELKNSDIKLKSFIHTKQYTLSIRVNDQQQIMTEKETGKYTIGYLIGITQDEYNRAFKENINLADNEILACSNFVKLDDKLQIDNLQYTIKNIIHQPDLLSTDDAAAEKKLIIIMKDENSIQEMMSSFFADKLDPTENLSIVYQNQSDEEKAENILNQCIDEFLITSKKGESTISFYHSSQYETRQMLMELYGSLFFLGMFLGILFLMATILIMYYKQLSEGYEDQKRFEIMQKVGMSKKEVKQTIRSQILIFFFAPLLVSMMHMAFAFHMITLMMMSFLITNIQVFIISTIISIIIMTIIYAIVYIFTSKTYYHIVSVASTTQ